MSLPQIAIPGFDGLSHTVNTPNSGRQNAVDSAAAVLSNEDKAVLDSILTKLNASLAVTAASLPLPTGAATSANQTALNALFPTSLGTKTAANSLAVTLASDGTFATAIGASSDAVVANGASGTALAYLRTIKDGITSTTPSPVVGPGSYETVAASATDQAMGATGATGDYLSHVLIVPATTSPGAVSIKDGSGSAITIFTGGSSSVSNLVPFAIAIGATSTGGAWKLTTGANVSAIGIGKFT